LQVALPFGIDAASPHEKLSRDRDREVETDGRASDPEILLESQPPLPRDEILSRVLFGKSKGRLTALEAAQLAASAAELSGGGGGLDVLGTIRRFVGADVLQVDAGENGAQVKAGKYIADGVYVGAKQGASPGSTSVEVEVEVTPNISVNTETGQADSNVGVQFKWDY
jgi:translocation and assembly module TamB